jgi:hypothetical protein
MNQLFQDLAQTKALLLANKCGIVQGELYNAVGFCIDGAIAQATGYDLKIKPEQLAYNYLRDNPRARACVVACYHELPGSWQTPAHLMYPYEALYGWHDEPGRTLPEVLDLVQRAADKASL